MKRTRSIVVTAAVSLAAVVVAGAWYTSGASAGAAPARRGTPAELEERLCAGRRDASSRRERVAERRDALLGEIAAKVGVDPAQLEDAARSVLIDRLDERLADAVEGGRISEDRAEELLDAARSGTLADLLEQHAGDGPDGRFPRLRQLRDRTMARICD